MLYIIGMHRHKSQIQDHVQVFLKEDGNEEKKDGYHSKLQTASFRVQVMKEA